MSFSVWVTGGDAVAVAGTVDTIAERLAARGLPVETLDERTPGVDALAGDVRAAAFVAETLARHGVATLVGLRIPARDERDGVRARVARMIEVHVSGGDADGYEPPDRAEVEIDSPAGVARVLGTLEVLGLLPRDERRDAEAEEREVIRRLKAFGYL